MYRVLFTVFGNRETQGQFSLGGLPVYLQTGDKGLLTLSGPKQRVQLQGLIRQGEGIVCLADRGRRMPQCLSLGILDAGVESGVGQFQAGFTEDGWQLQRSFLVDLGGGHQQVELGHQAFFDAGQGALAKGAFQGQCGDGNEDQQHQGRGEVQA